MNLPALATGEAPTRIHKRVVTEEARKRPNRMVSAPKRKERWDQRLCISICVVMPGSRASTLVGIHVDGTRTYANHQF